VVLAAMLAGVVGQATHSHSQLTLEHTHSQQREQASVLLETALARVAPEHAALIARHYLEREPLRALAVEQDVSYATVRRRHEAALKALAEALSGLLAEASPKERAGRGG
jgi:DNA-directed RNA polymerase specialized sigma24 family protein